MNNDAMQVKDAAPRYGAQPVAQDVPPGFMSSAAGLLPRDWNVKPLGELASFRTGPFGSALHKSDYIEGGIPLINPMHIVDGVLVPESETSVSEHAANRLADFRLRRDDIVIGRRGDMGRCAVVRESQAGWLCGTGSLIIRSFGDVDVTFLQRVLTTARVIGLIEGASVGSTMVNLNQTALATLPIQCPPLLEQRAIAEALSDVDGLLGALEALIAKKRAIKQAAMQQLLTGKTRLPGFSGEWETKRLGDVCQITTGRKDVNEENPVGQFPFFTCSRSHTFSDSYSFDSEAILIAGNGEVGNLHYYKGKFEAYQRTYVLTDFMANVHYLWQQLSTFLVDSLGIGKIGSSIPYIKKENLLGFQFCSPRDPAEQTVIATVLSDMDREIAALEARRDKTRAIKQGMMQQLLTGRVRLVKPEAAA